MITRLVEATSKSPHRERRASRRFEADCGTILADAASTKGSTHRVCVADISPRGVRLVGTLPFDVGDRFSVAIHLNLGAPPFNIPAVVAHRDDDSLGANFTS